jgi:hypothetical protein
MTKGGEKRPPPLGEEHVGLVQQNSGESSRYGSFLGSLTGSFSGNNANLQLSLLERSMRYTLGRFSDGDSLRMFQFAVEDEKPSDLHGLHDIELNSFEERISCFLWQQSYFYSTSKFSRKAWNLRWFTFTANTVRSVPDRTESIKHSITYPHFNEIHADEDRLIIRIVHPDPQKRNCKFVEVSLQFHVQSICSHPFRADYLMAPSKEVFETVVKKLEDIIAKTAGQDEDDSGIVQEDDPESHGSLLEFPHGGSNLAIILSSLSFL